MRRYETIFILDPDLSKEDQGAIFDKLNEMIPEHNGFLVHRDEWGIKKLAYDIKKKMRGNYVRLDYCGMGDLVDEMERFFRIEDRVLKYMTVLLNRDADIAQIKEEMAAAEEAEKKARDAARAEAEAAEKAAADAPKTDPENPDEPETAEAPSQTETHEED